MSDANGAVIGIRRRFPSGRKISVKGSRNGLFIPTDLSKDEPLMICEGPTDTAGALDLGFDAIGRPNCNSLIEMTAQAIRGRNKIVVVGDNDDAGRRGAVTLADTLILRARVKVVFPPGSIKDLRAWLQAGLTQEQLRNIIDSTDEQTVRIISKDQ